MISTIMMRMILEDECLADSLRRKVKKKRRDFKAKDFEIQLNQP